VLAPRRLSALAVTAALAAVPAAAHAQGAGDQQYSDPLGDGGSPTTTAQSKPAPTTKPKAPTTTQAPDPAAAPQLDSSAPSTSSTSTAADSASSPAVSSSPAPVATSSALPNTGTDATAVALLGAGFMLAGAGLRLRLRDERA
jgi:LPXTG-motif cell wall-anchored protein